MTKARPVHMVRKTLRLAAAAFIVTWCGALGAAHGPLAAGAALAQDGDGEAGAAMVVRSAQLAGDGKRTRFVMDLSAPIEFSVSTLADPYRIVIDLPALRFDLPDTAGRESLGLIRAWRFGQFAPGKSRIVIDANEPVAVDKAFVLPPVSGQAARFVLDLVGSDRDAFLKSVAESKPHTPATRKSDRMARAGSPHKPLIVLDPGHGGIDTGAVGNGGTLEKAIVLDFSKRLRDRLKKNGRYEVRMTRDTDVFIPLRERVKIARGLQADLLVSIHADSVRIGRDQVRGAGIYTLSDKASDAIAAALAERENRSDVLAGIDLAEEPDDVSDILIDLTRQETRKFSFLFAETLEGELRGAAQLVKNPRRSAGFRVLTAHDVPSTLIELGYLSNKLDEKLMTTDEWRERMGEAIEAAIDRYFDRRFGDRAMHVTQTTQTAAAKGAE
uniref:N-acetylmuramoyl-L-alanine amidase n=1 Tax=Stappia sp. TaxID=1870903 RepID=UPI003BA9691B